MRGEEQSRLGLGRYGRPRMTELLKEIGLDVDHRREGRLMHQVGLSVVRTRNHKVTADRDHTFNIAPDLLDRDLKENAPNHNWAGRSQHVCFANTLPVNGHQLYLDALFIAVFGRGHGPALKARHWFDR